MRAPFSFFKSAGGGGGGPSFDPLSLTPTIYLVDYAGTTWVDATGHARNFIAGTDIGATSPAVGANFGSHPSADFNGSTNAMAGDGFTVGDILSASAFTMQFIAEFDTLAAPTGSVYLDATLIGDRADGDIYVTCTTAGVAAGYWSNGGGYITTTPVPVTTGVKYCIQVRLDSGVLTCAVRGVGSSSVSSPDLNAATVGRTPWLSDTYLDGGRVDARIAQFFAKNTALSTADLDALYADAQARFAVPLFVPENKALSAYWSARVNDYAGPPWPGVPSAGVSGTTGDLSTASADPSIGAALNGHVPPSYVAASSQHLQNSTDILDVVAKTGGTIFGLFNAASALAPAVGTPGSDDPPLLTDGNFDLGVVFTSDGVAAYGYSSGYVLTPAVAAAVGDWHMFVVTWDGTTFSCYVDSLSPSTATCGAFTVTTGILLAGNSHATTYLDATVPELGTSFDVWSATDVADFRAYVNRVYGLSL